MKWLDLSMIMIVAVLLSSCSDGTSPAGIDDSAFELRILLLDSNEDPLPGHRISAWNKAPCWVAEDGCWWERSHALRPRPLLARDLPRFFGNSPNPFSHDTVWRFDLPDSCHVQIKAFDLEHEFLTSIVDDPLPQGHHSIAWDGRPRYSGSAVYECQLAVWTPDRDSLVFQDTLYACSYDTDPSGGGGLLGVTDSDGVVATEARVRFPSTYDYPALAAVDAEGTALGTFVFSDTLIIAAVDSSSGEQRLYERVLADGKNELELVWE